VAYKVIERRMMVPNIHELVVEAPDVARSLQPGQFVIVRPSDDGERVPLSVSDFDPEAGTVTCFFQEVGESTQKLALLQPGDTIPTFAGPLGVAAEIKNFGTVMLVGGCFGIGSIYPLGRALKAAGNRVITVVEGRSKYLIYWQDKHKSYADEFYVITRDGTLGTKGHVSKLPELINRMGLKLDRVIANGCTFMMKRVSDITRPLEIPTYVSMNPIMIDGTGMCGVCRLTVGGETKFACVDGPDFNAHLIDWDEFLSRRKTYYEEEVEPLRRSGIGTEIHVHICRNH